MKMTAKQKKLSIGVTVVVALMAGRFILHSRSQQAVMERSDQFILYSLVPDSQAKVKTVGTFHRYGVLGQADINDQNLKAQLVKALYNGINQTGDESGCFNPRHGIRAVRGERTVDAVICFECSRVEFYEIGSRNPQLISYEPQKVFDQALNGANLPLGKRPH
jgi:hypothetical protein